MAMEISASMFIRENVLVDPLMADLKVLVLPEPIRDLLRAPVLTDQLFDQEPGGGFNTIPGSLTSIQGKLMSLLRTVSFQSTISPQFPADGRLMDLDKISNFRLVKSCFPWSGSSTEVRKSGIFAEGG
jgi:hypothetical protein